MLHASHAATVNYVFRSGITGKCMDDWRRGSTNGTIVDLYGCNNTAAQEWSSNSNGTIENANGKCLDNWQKKNANGNPIKIYSCSSTDPAQQWRLTGNILKNPQTGKCVDDPASSTTNGKPLELYTCNGKKNQQWTATPINKAPTPVITPPSTTASTSSGCAYNGVAAPCIGSSTTGASGWGALAFDDEFNGTSLNANVWSPNDGWTNQNNVTTYASNVTASNGDAILSLISSSSGAEIETKNFNLPVGGFAEASIDFPGSGTTIYNWPGWWISGPNWPAAGESDIAEGLGTLTVNYHSPSGTHNQGTIPGIWSNAFHTYGIYRGSNYCDVYYDGKLVKTYSTDDNGQPEQLILTLGSGNTGAYGTASQVKVNYVRAWK